jgi:hypothetical protein
MNNTFIFVKLIKSTHLVLIFFFCSSFGFAQSGLGILDLYHDTFLSPSARMLTEKADINDNAFYFDVGGIVFEAIAKPAENLENEKVSLDYSDGRLIINLAGENFYPVLPDWQLVPIANFADTPYQSAFSALGDTVGNKEAQCKYHPAFLDNLLGLRLFQADLLNRLDIIWEIPIDARRNYLFAQSETGYTPHLDTLIYQKLYADLSGGQKKFSSYVLTDKDVNINFEIRDSKFQLNGVPYYYFIKMEVNEVRIKMLRSKLEMCYEEIDSYAKLFLRDKYTSELNPRNNLKGLLAAVNANKKNESFNPYAAHYLRMSINKLDSMNRMSNEDIGVRINPLDVFSNEFKKDWPVLKEYNPLVYSAVENTARWAAFFRYVKNSNPENWQLFLKKVNGIKFLGAPSINTPTSYEINYFRMFPELNSSANK